MPNLTMWLKADDGIGVANGGNVTTWPDQSVLGINNANQGTAANQPLFAENAINFNPALTFDGVNDNMESVRVGIDGTMDMDAVDKLLKPIIPGSENVLLEDYLD